MSMSKLSWRKPAAIDGPETVAATRVPTDLDVSIYWTGLTNTQEKNGLFILHDKSSNEVGVECVIL
jgi:hypothetical protein